MYKLINSLFVLCFFISHAQKKSTTGYPISQVPFTSVKVTDHFWGQRFKASRATTIPLAFGKCESTGRYDNFVKATHPDVSYQLEGFPFDDTDVYKIIEGASYSMQTYPDKKLDKYLDSLITIMEKAQEPDGYLYTYRTMNPKHPHKWSGTKRWEKVEDLSHELYNLGHMIEGAVAHYQATGKKNFLNIAIKFANCAIREVGDQPEQTMVVPGHQITEMAMAKLSVTTGNKKYLDFAKLLLDKRGHTHIKTEYSQSHKPVLEQGEAVGHAVRAAYMYTGMADVAALTGDEDYIHAIDKIWDNIVSKKLYITGGIGATNHGEAFGKNYELPNMSAYCETCAAIGNVYLNHRLFLLHGEAKYYDVLERTLYNGLISGVSLDGDSFFYPNPLESIGQHQRKAWFGCACCPSNISRFIPSVPGYIYAVNNSDVYINLFMSNHSNITINNKKVELTQTTNYPWSGDINIKVSPKGRQNFNLKIRIPGWLQNHVVPSDLYKYSDKKTLGYTIKVNGKQMKGNIEKGYFNISRIWKKGDQIDIQFDMETRTVNAHPNVKADRSKVAIERGPIVYCAEWPDNDFDIFSIILNKNPKFKVEKKNDLLYGINMVKTSAQSLSYNDAGKLEIKDVQLNMIPYYAWAHRGSGNMAVWLPTDLNATRPTTPPTIASESKINTSHKTNAMSAINDGLTPKDPEDNSLPYYHWWPKEGTTEWVSYDFKTDKTVSRSTVYWYDDKPWGGCKIPEKWTIFYKDSNGTWQPVENKNDYELKKNIGNEVVFKPVTTKALKLEVKLAEKNSAGIFEWVVE